MATVFPVVGSVTVTMIVCLVMRVTSKTVLRTTSLHQPTPASTETSDVLTASVSPAPGTVTVRLTAMLEMTRLMISARERPLTVERSSPAGRESALITGERISHI